MRVKNCKLSTVIRTVRVSLKAKFISVWKKALENNEKLIIYRKIKTVFRYEKYLSLVQNPFDRIGLTKTRISNHISRLKSVDTRIFQSTLDYVLYAKV